MSDWRPTFEPWLDEEIIGAAQAVDPRAIATVLSCPQARVRRFDQFLGSTLEEAEGAAQEALIVLFRKIGTLRATAALASWIFQIARNECFRRSRRALHGPIPLPAIAPSAEDAAITQLELELLVDAIARLPSEQRTVVVCATSRGLSGPATAEALRLTRAEMNSRLHRDRQLVRSRLGGPRE